MPVGEMCEEFTSKLWMKGGGVPEECVEEFERGYWVQSLRMSA